MKINRLLYIGSILLLAGCTNETDFSDTLSGNGKTPLMIEATLNTGRAQTRASGASFANGDVLKAYIRHTYGGTKGSYSIVDASYAKKLVTITKNESGFSSDSYWDDFSNSDDNATDLRTTGHGLHSLYGYCYNGGTPTSLNEGTGVLVWTIGSGTPIDQSSALNVQKADLLWSPEQETVTYDHSTAHSANHGTISLPYTHAMSQITVEVFADNNEGFTVSSRPLQSTQLVLNGMNTETTLTGPTTGFSPAIQTEGTKIKNVRMYADTSYPGANEFIRIFTAVVAPGTTLKEDEKLLDILNVDGNYYTVSITSAMLGDETWGNGHVGTDQIGTDGGGKKYVITQPGKNYKLTVTVKKSSIHTNATLANWTNVTATGIGDINLYDVDTNLIMDDSGTPGTVYVVAVDKNRFKGTDPAASFSLFTLRAVTSGSGANTGEGKGSNTRPNNTSGSYTGYEYATTSTFQDNEGDDNDEWVNSPIIYWPNTSDNYYFRAIARFNSVEIIGGIDVNDISNVGSDKATAVSVSQGTIGGGNDILWGTTASHWGYNAVLYQRSQAIPPRKGGVPIMFSHAMSKVSFSLETTSNAAAKVDLAGAYFNISNIYTSGTITIDNGVINPSGDPVASTLSEIVNNEFTGTSTSLFTEKIVVPQNFGENAKVNITLNNGATYSVPLKDCVVSGGSTPITAWEGGKNYAYTIHVEKEKIKFNALVKDWDNVTVSGSAVLNWQALGANE